MKTLAERFWAKVDKNGPVPAHRPELGPCWLWTGAVSRAYGHMSVGPKGCGHIRAHRVSWELHFGPIPDGRWALHSCDNRICVNPTHLFLGTAKDNTQDMLAKGRCSAGWHNREKTHCKHGHALTPDNLVKRTVSNGWRECLTCSRERSADYKRRVRAAGGVPA